MQMGSNSGCYNIIQLVYQKVHDVVALVEKIMPEHVSSDLVEQMWKTEEEVLIEAERVVKIVEYFQNKINASQNMEQ